MHYTHITTEDAIDAVLNDEKLQGREIPDLRALIEGLQKRASDPDRFSLACRCCCILNCQCMDLRITFHMDFSVTKFSREAYFRNASFMKGANFDGATFTKSAHFRGATFTEDASFFEAQLTGVDFRDATFTQDAIFSAATCSENAFFDGATFTENARFRYATFTGYANFDGATFTKDTNFNGATFTKCALFSRTTFSKDTELSGNFAGADFTRANFNQCPLHRTGFVANLEGANLEHTKGLILDSTPIRNARFSPRATDPWSQLRRAYTGPRLIFTLMFLVAFFTPYALKTAGWVGVNRVQEELKQHIEEVRDRVDALDSEQHPAVRPLTVALEAVADRLPHDNDDRWQTKSVWELVLGMDKKWTYWLTAIVLLAYNVCRAGLTWFVAPMRDAEERSGVSPAYRRDTSNAPETGQGWNAATWPYRWIVWCYGTFSDSYRWLILPHRFAQVVFLLAVISFCLHAVYWLQLPVTLPAAAG